MKRVLVVFALLGFLAAVGGCAKDDIPSSPGEPYLFTRLAIERDMSPVPGSILTKGQVVTARYRLAYTLTPGDAQRRAALRIFVGVYGISAADTLVAMGVFPRHTVLMNAASEEILDSLSFTVPAAAKTVSLEAFIDSTVFRNPVMSIDSRTWNVQ